MIEEYKLVKLIQNYEYYLNRLNSLTGGSIDVRETENKKYIYQHIKEDGKYITKYIGEYSDSLYYKLQSDNSEIKFIMVQIPELIEENSDYYREGFRTICDIGKKRICNVIDNIDVNENDNVDLGFKVFKLDSSNLQKWDPDYDNLEQTLLVSQDNIKDDRSQEDLIYEIMLKYGIDLTLPIEEYDAGENKIYSIGFGALLICLDNKITKDLADSIIELASEDVSRVVFKDNGFASDADKTNIKETLRTHGIDEFITI